MRRRALSASAITQLDLIAENLDDETMTPAQKDLSYLLGLVDGLEAGLAALRDSYAPPDLIPEEPKR